MSEKRIIKYGTQQMDLPDDMTLEQAKQQMARFFPELAEPQVETKKDGDTTTYTFSKKAGRKGTGAFEQHAIVELFGHQVIAGLVTEAVIGGCNFIRVDVPAVDDQPAFTKFYGEKAIYCMTPADESAVLAALRRIRPRPIDPLILPALAAPVGDTEDEEEDFDDDLPY